MLSNDLELESTTCPYCAETILKKARKCKHCGEMLDNTIHKSDFIKELSMFKVNDSLGKKKKNYPWFWHLIFSLLTGFWVFFWIAFYFNRDRDIYH